MGIVLRIICCLFLVSFARPSVLPVEKCNLEDSGCMVPAFQKALPVFVDGMSELGVEVLDVMEMDYVEFDLSGLQFTLKDGRLKGLKNSVIDNVKWDLKKQRFEVEFHLNSTIKGHYTAAGRILILPITGDGELNLKLQNVLLKFYIDYEMEKGTDGKDHVKPKKMDFTYEVKDNANFHLTNLFNGNKELSDTMIKFLNENWKEISTEFGKPLIANAAKKLFKNMVAFFKNVPIGDIANI